jgi:hypothetical protein
MKPKKTQRESPAPTSRGSRRRVVAEDFGGGNRFAAAQARVAEKVAAAVKGEIKITYDDIKKEVAPYGLSPIDLEMRIMPLFDALVNVLKYKTTDEQSKSVLEEVPYGSGKDKRALDSDEIEKVVSAARKLSNRPKSEGARPTSLSPGAYPFRERLLSSSRLLREFSRDVTSDELVWHRDREGRIVRTLEGRGWALQVDGALPVPLRLGESHHIPAGTWHRLLRRSEVTTLRLVVELKKGDRVKHGGKAATIKVPDGRGDLVGIDPAGPDDMKMVPGDELEPLREKDAADKKGHPRQYAAPEGSKRDRQLDASSADLKSDDPERRDRAWRRRERMEKKEREKPGWKNKPRADTKTEGFEALTETDLREMIQDVLEEELSKKLKATLRKKAEERGLTPGSVEAEYKKGLAAWGTSGSRKGISQHAWAMARVNAATPSKPWAMVKKSKVKKKKD